MGLMVSCAIGKSIVIREERWCGDILGWVVDVIAGEISSSPRIESANESPSQREICRN